VGTLTRLTGLAAFCLIFGFLGSLGGLWVMNGHLRGPQGQPGASGVAGPAGPPGARGSAGKVSLPANVANLNNVLTNLETEQRELSDRVQALETPGATRTGPGTSGVAAGDCMPTQVVTDVEQGYSTAEPFIVRKLTVCLPLG
jgi:hypothetical protein